MASVAELSAATLRWWRRTSLTTWAEVAGLTSDMPAATAAPTSLTAWKSERTKPVKPHDRRVA